MRRYCKGINKELPTDDLIYLFAEWIILNDRWDREYSHSAINIVSDLEAKATRGGSTPCFGEYVIKKGDKQVWKLKVNTPYILIGIIKEEILKLYPKTVDDFTNRKYEGYGVNFQWGDRFHDVDKTSYSDFEYVCQFDFYGVVEDDSLAIVFEMELDLTQKENENGILKFVIDHDKIRTDGKYTNVCWDNIDINENYRLAVDIGGNVRNKIEFIVD